MTVLSGEYRNTLDEKGRILFPSRLRSALAGNSLIITQGLDRCLSLFTVEEWGSFSGKIMENTSLFNGQNRLVLRRLIAPAQEVEFDRSGRLSIPQSLREYARLTKDCVVLGLNKYMELWDYASYCEYLDSNDDAFKEATEGLSHVRF